MPHAENTGDIVRIGAWVIREACRQLRAWADAGLGLLRVSVNVSYRQFLSENLVEVVSGALQRHALPGSALELELTERVLIEDAPDTLETFKRLREQGVQLVIESTGLFTDAEKASAPTVVLTTEQSVVAQNESSPDHQFFALYPKDGTVSVSYPFVRVAGSTTASASVPILQVPTGW